MKKAKIRLQILQVFASLLQLWVPLGFAQQGGDLCANAPLIPEIPFCDIGTTHGYASDYSNTCNGSGPDVVYHYIPTVNETVRFSLCGSNFDCVLALWHGCPSEGGEQLICNDDFCGSSSCLSSALNAGEEYYAIIDGYDGGAGDYRFHAVPVHFNCPGTRCGDFYDECAGAQLIVPGSEFPNAFPGSTIGATIDMPPVAPNCSLPSGPGVWFVFTGSDSIVTVSIPVQTTPHQLYAFCGSCNNLTCIDTTECDQVEPLEFCTQLGMDYYLLVAACSPSMGTFDLNIAFTTSCSPPVCTIHVPPPSNLTIGRDHPDLILRWRAPVGTAPDHYVIYRAIDPTNLVAPENQIAVRSSLEYIDNNILLTPNAHLFYAVTSAVPD